MRVRTAPAPSPCPIDGIDRMMGLNVAHLAVIAGDDPTLVG
jgi:hypothetical protein